MKNDMEKIFESYLNQSAIQYDQQRNTANQRFSPSQNKNSNYQQFSGLTGNGQMNAAQVPSFGGFDDEEEPMVTVKGYGKVSLQQVKKMAKEQGEKINEYLKRGNYNVEGQVELLKLFCKTVVENTKD